MRVGGEGAPSHVMIPFAGADLGKDHGVGLLLPLLLLLAQARGPWLKFFSSCLFDQLNMSRVHGKVVP
jgi:hypothetical protein